jgi:chromosome segregation ATPase
VAGATLSDKVVDLQKLTSALEERVDGLGEDAEGIIQRVQDTEKLSHDLDKRLAILADRVDRHEKNLEEIRTKRWDVWKIVLGAILGCLLTLASGIAGRWIERQVSPRPAAAERK